MTASPTSRHRRLIGYAAMCGAGFVAVLVLVGTGRPRLDLQIAEWIAANRTDAGILIARGLSRSGSVISIVPTAIVLAIGLWRRDGWHSVVTLALSSVGALVLYLTVNQIMHSPRPPFPMRLSEELGWSFPSGHSTQAMAFWPVVACLVGRTPRMRHWLMLPALVLVAGVGGSRVYLDVHWTTDVTGGFLLGASWLFCVLAYRNRAMAATSR